MAKSGIIVKDDLQKKFVELSESKDVAWIMVQIDEEPSFTIAGTGKISDAKEEFTEMAAKLPARDPAYFIYRADREKNKWVAVFYVPDVSKVKERMIYASSIAELQRGFGQAKFVPISVYRISEGKECTAAAYAQTLEQIDQREIMTSGELLAQEARNDSVNSVSGSKVSAIVGMPVKVQDGATGFIEEVKDGKTTTLLLQLNNETEVLERIDSGDYSLEDVAKKLTRQDPRFIVHNFRHPNEGKEINSIVFIYYCPDGAKPRLKMFYSSCKNVVQQIVTTTGITIAKSLECSEPNEVSSANVLSELYPQAVVKAGFKKPQSKGGRKGMIGGVKFSASGSSGSLGGPASPASPVSPESPDPDL